MDIIYWLGLDNTLAFSLLISDQIADSVSLVKLQFRRQPSVVGLIQLYYQVWKEF